MIELNVSFYIQLINFLLLILILHLFLFKPILKNLNRRDEMIRSLREDTERLNKRAYKLTEDYNAGIADARKESLEIINKAKTEASEEQNRVLSEAKENFKNMVDNAKAQIQSETEKASLKLKEQVEPLSLFLAKRILGREVN
ncbi:MAG: F0F1 ATP synthase subunit B [Nitrospinae bacterium]|nr:F0F1 ATP synthase subunit B [Nitrospinota bacterium]